MSRRVPVALVAVAAGLLLVSSASAEAPQINTPATITGTAAVGQQLTAHNGTWLYDNGTSCGPECKMSYQWERCDAAGGSCASIEGANSRFYTVQAADAGSRLRVMEQMSIHDCGAGDSQTGVVECRWDNRTAPSGLTAVVPGGNGAPSAPSAPTPPSTPAGPPAQAPLAPTPTAAPQVSGIAMVDETVSATTGLWSGTGPLSVGLEWLRCDAAGQNCEGLGVTAASYTVIPVDIGKTLRVRVTAFNGLGARQALSEPTTVVTELKPTESKPAIAAGRVTAPHRLVVQELVIAPSRFRSRGPLSISVRVLDTRGFQVEGAIVTARTLPATAVRPSTEVVTASDGTATLVFGRGSAVKSKIKTLRIVLIARRPGDKLTSPRGAVVKRSIPIARVVRR